MLELSTVLSNISELQSNQYTNIINKHLKQTYNINKMTELVIKQSNVLENVGTGNQNEWTS